MCEINLFLCSYLEPSTEFKARCAPECMKIKVRNSLVELGSDIKILAELAEHSPIIIQNSSNPLSQKNLDV